MFLNSNINNIQTLHYVLTESSIGRFSAYSSEEIPDIEFVVQI